MSVNLPVLWEVRHRLADKTHPGDVTGKRTGPGEGPLRTATA